MKMYKKIELITQDEHKNSGVASVDDFKHTKEFTTPIITMQEYYESCKHYPIIFSKNDEEGWFSIALLGLEKENNFVNEEGAWRGGCYIPAYIRRYPFIYIRNNDELLLGFDSTHKIDKDKAGDRYFFDDNGEKTEFVDKVLNFMNQVQNDSNQTKKFIETLAELDILEESTIKGTNSEGKEININGFWIVKENKLNELTKEDKSMLCEKNYMQPITAHLISLSNIQKLK